MTILGIDTSAVSCSAAIVSENQMLSYYFSKNGLTHSQVLLPAIRTVLNEAGMNVNDLDGIAISCGPGSFTGLRIGISTVKGLAVTSHIPCIPVSTLEAMAMNGRNLEGKTVCCLMDARRGEYYHARFFIQEGKPRRLSPDQAIVGDAIADQIKNTEDLILFGDGAQKFTERFEAFSSSLAPESIRYQNGEGVALLGQRFLLEKKYVSSDLLAPNYLRLPQAEREWLAKQNKNI